MSKGVEDGQCKSRLVANSKGLSLWKPTEGFEITSNLKINDGTWQKNQILVTIAKEVYIEGNFSKQFNVLAAELEIELNGPSLFLGMKIEKGTF